MFVCIESYDRVGTDAYMVKVSDRAIEMALEFGANENSDEDEIEDFLENTDGPFMVIQLLTAMCYGEVEPNEDGTITYVGEEMTVGVGKTKAEAKAAFAAATFGG